MTGIIHLNKFCKTLSNFIFLGIILPDLLIVNIANVFLTTLTRSKYTLGDKRHTFLGHIVKINLLKYLQLKLLKMYLTDWLIMSYYFCLQ